MPAPAATLGIDVGTSAVKVALVDADGRAVAEASTGYPTHAPRPGWIEQDPHDWWRATVTATAACLARAPDATVEGVGLSGQLNGVVLLDAAGEPLGNALIWLDTRAAAEAEELAARFGDVLRDRAETTLGPIAVLAKLAWLSRHQPERLAAARRILFVKDYILFRLTGAVATDPSDACSAGMMDHRTLDWIPELARAAGFEPVLLPPIRPATAVGGHVLPAAAEQTSLPEGTPVVVGGGDVAALAVGCGVVAPGVLGITLGTAGHVVLAGERTPGRSPRRGLWQIVHADPSLSIRLGLVMSGGLSLSWLHRLLDIGPTPLDFAAMTALAGDIAPGADGVVFLPFLEGVATPYANPAMRGRFAGLSSSHRAGHLVQAVMEGVGFNIRQCVDLIEAGGDAVREVRLAEGGARVDRWCGIIADILARPIARLAQLDTSSLGAALMAQSGVWRRPLARLAAARQGVDRVFEPDPERIRAYAAAFSRYEEQAASEDLRSRGGT